MASSAVEGDIDAALGIKAPPRAMLDVHKNPLLISILDAVDTLKTMGEKGTIPPLYLQNAKGILAMKTDKVSKTYNCLCRGDSGSGCELVGC